MTTPSAERFDYIEAYPSLGSASALPYAPIALHFGDRDIRVSALVDSRRDAERAPLRPGTGTRSCLGPTVRPGTAGWEHGGFRGLGHSVDREDRTIRTRTPCFRLDPQQPRSRHPWPDQFLHGVRHPILPLAAVLRNRTAEEGRGLTAVLGCNKAVHSSPRSGVCKMECTTLCVNALSARPCGSSRGMSGSGASSRPRRTVAWPFPMRPSAAKGCTSNGPFPNNPWKQQRNQP